MNMGTLVGVCVSILVRIQAHMCAHTSVGQHVCLCVCVSGFTLSGKETLKSFSTGAPDFV